MSRGVVNVWRTVAASVAFGGAYAVAALARCPLPGALSGHLPVWFPTGIALGGLLLVGPWAAVAVGVAVVAVVMLHGVGIGDGLAMAVVVTAQALAGWWLLTRPCCFDLRLARVRDVVVLVGLGAGIGTLLNPTFGAALFSGRHGLGWPDGLDLWRSWWLADSLGVLLVTPLILAWGTRPVRPWRRREWVDVGLTVALLVGCGVSVFVLESASIYLMAPPLVLAALRLGQRGTTAASFAVALWTMAATSWKQGPFGVQSGMTLVVDLQAFLVVMSLMAILLSASIAERESTRAALLEGDERFRVLAESSPDVIMRFDRAYRHSYVNPAVEGQTGIPARAFLGKTHRELGFPEHLAEVWEDAIEAVFRTGLSHRREFQLPSGTWIDWMLAPELGDDGRVTFVSTVARDITQRKQAEVGLERQVAQRTAELEQANLALRQEFAYHEAAREALQRSEERYRRLVETSPDAIFMADMSGRFLAANLQAARMHGFESAEDLVSGVRLGQDLVAPGSRGRVRQAFARLLRDGLVQGVRLTLLRRDGTAFEAEVSASLLGTGEGMPFAFMGVTRDVSERVHAEEHLRESQKMRAVGQLAGGIAHDFNNLLQALLGGIEALRQRGSDEAVRSRLVEEMAADVQRGAALTRQLLLFVRQEVTHMQRLDLGQVTVGAARLLRRLLQENIELVVSSPDEPLPVEADRSQLEQVLLNLTLNAAAAVQEVGRIGIRTGSLGVDQVFVEVSDDGMGIPRELRTRIFEPFFTTKEGGKGTGLGLAVVKSIAAHHGGHVEVQSVVGEGSTFRVVLPRRLGSGEQEAVMAETARLPGAEQHTGWVLLVEDEPSAREGLTAMLEMIGYQAVAVGSGEEALALPLGVSFDLLLTDLLLPGMHGGELIRKARERWPGIRVLVMSGYAEDEAVRRGVLDGSVRFLQKPFGAAVLERELCAAHGHPVIADDAIVHG